MTLKILVIDDDYTFAQFAKLLIEKLGFEASVTLDGAQGIKMAKAEKPNLILLDVAMPEMSGLEVIRRLKADPDTEKIPILVCSISKEKSELNMAFDLGARDFLAKPLNLPVLKARIDEALKNG